MKRRMLLAGAIVAPLALGLPGGWPGNGRLDVETAAPDLLIHDARLPRAAHAAREMRRRGGQARETGGEIAALLLREKLLSGTGAILGVTGHAEFVLATDIARLAGRRIAPLMQMGAVDRWLGSPADGQWFGIVHGLLGDGRHARGAASEFAWLVAAPARAF